MTTEVTVTTSKNRVNDLLRFLKKVFPNKEQTFFTRNLVGDPMENIYDKDGISVDLCYYYGYIEIFGLTSDERKIVEKKGWHCDARSCGRIVWDIIEAEPTGIEEGETK